MPRGILVLSFRSFVRSYVRSFLSTSSRDVGVIYDKVFSLSFTSGEYLSNHLPENIYSRAIVTLRIPVSKPRTPLKSDFFSIFLLWEQMQISNQPLRKRLY